MDSNESVINAEQRSDFWWLFGVFALLLLLYSPTILSFYNVYSEEGSGASHAPLLLLVTLYLLYRNWSLSGQPIRLHFNYFALVALVGLSLLWMVLGLVFVEAGQQAMLILILAAAIIGMLGIREGSRYLIPILLLLTVVPVWSVVTPYLQTVAAAGSAFLLDMAGFTSIREGYLLIIPNGTFEVAGACSGLKFQITGITLALIHTQLIKVPARVMLLYVVLASLLALLSNLIRIVLVVVIAYEYGMEHEYVEDHNFIGWILFSIFFFLFLFIGERRLRSHEIKRTAKEVDSPERATSIQMLSGVAIVILTLSVGPILYGYFMNQPQDATNSEIHVLDQIPGWRVASRQLSDWTPLWTEGDRTFQGVLTSGEGGVDLFASEFSRQHQGHEAVNVSHRVYDIEKWSRISRSARVVEVPGIGEVTVEETLLKSSGQRKRLVWLWYRTNGNIVASRVQAKLNNLLGVFSGNPEISVFVASREIVRDEVHAAGVLESFLKAYLDRVGDGP